MELGVSTSCLYPLETEKALRKIGELGIKHTEVFFNSPSELQKDYLKKLCKIKDFYGLDIGAFHPYMSFAEGFYIFSCYKRRFIDSLEMYKPMFNAASEIGAKYFVMHGAKLPMETEKEEYAERFYLFNKTAKEFGVSVAHENVVYYASQKPIASPWGFLGEQRCAWSSDQCWQVAQTPSLRVSQQHGVLCCPQPSKPTPPR